MIEVVKARVVGAILNLDNVNLDYNKFMSNWPLWRIRAKNTRRESVFILSLEDPATWATPRASPSAIPWITKPRRRAKALSLSVLASRILAVDGGSRRRSEGFSRPISPSSASNSTSKGDSWKDGLLCMKDIGSFRECEWEWGDISCSMINIRVNPTTRHRAMRPVGSPSLWAAAMASIPLIPLTF